MKAKVQNWQVLQRALQLFVTRWPAVLGAYLVWLLIVLIGTIAGGIVFVYTEPWTCAFWQQVALYSLMSLVVLAFVLCNRYILHYITVNIVYERPAIPEISKVTRTLPHLLIASIVYYLSIAIGSLLSAVLGMAIISSGVIYAYAIFPYLIATVVYYCIAAFGLLLAIVPGISIALRGILYPYAVIEDNMDFWSALFESNRLMRGNQLQMLVLFFPLLLTPISSWTSQLMPLLSILFKIAILVYTAGILPISVAEYYRGLRENR